MGRGILKNLIGYLDEAAEQLPDSREAVPLTDFLLNFWTHDNSPYIKEKQRKGQGLSRNYTVGQIRAVESYIVPFFKGRVLGEITRRDIEAFIDFMAEKPLSAGRKNKIIHALTVPLRWAYNKEMTDRDLTAGIIWFSGKPKERQILTPETAAAGGAGPEARKKGRKTTRNRLAAAIAKHLENCGGIKKGDAHETRKNLPKSTLARIRNIALTADRFSLPANRQCQQIKKGERP